jgi:LysM repeat protein
MELHPGRPIITYGWVTLRVAEDGAALNLKTMMYDEPKVTGGLGGWDDVERKRRLSITEFKGGPGYQMVLPLIFDGFRDQTSIEPAYQSLEYMAQVHPGETEPPKLIVDGSGAIPHDHQNDPDLRWVIDDIDPQAGVQWHWGQRVRQLAIVTLKQHVEDDIIIKKASAKKPVKHYRLKKGDTLPKIAAKFHHSKDWWKKIAKINHIRDPYHPGKPGTLIKLP